MSNELKDWLRDTLVEELQARIAKLEAVAEAAVEWAHAAGQMPNKLQRALSAAGYLGGGDERIR